MHRARTVAGAVGLCGLALALVRCSASPGASGGAASAPDTTDPADATMVTTPYGPMNGECVAEVESTDVVVADDLPPCPTFLAAPNDGEAAPPPVGDDAGDDASEATFPVANGWVEYADWHATATPGVLATTWHVPDLPAEDNGQTIFYFPAYEPAKGMAIVQPVLQYGTSAAGGGSFWAISSWWVGTKGARHSTLLTVNPGDTIRGTITASNCSSSGGCKFVIQTRDETLDDSRQLTVVTGEAYTWVQAAVLEVYKVDRCSLLPDDLDVLFGSFRIAAQDGSSLTPTWAPETPLAIGCPSGVQVDPSGSSVLLE